MNQGSLDIFFSFPPTGYSSRLLLFQELFDVCQLYSSLLIPVNETDSCQGSFLMKGLRHKDEIERESLLIS